MLRSIMGKISFKQYFIKYVYDSPSCVYVYTYKKWISINAIISLRLFTISNNQRSFEVIDCALFSFSLFDSSPLFISNFS
ncbi:hypothetical protein L1987_56208 [Smallanthus sonchifolius]|uniref:Uncharacterized protein n=1 Tax=Smallanthus sonchifolius TaxID=185202 RepID=A0ACB9ECU7_9ASTR|nr:hypothetical protein L1987_56208 [Smallanthus sonchifolius]